MCTSGSCGSSKSGIGLTLPSASRWCMRARRARIDGVIVKAVLVMPSGAKMRSCMNSPSRLPVIPSTTWPAQSMLQPYSQSSPGSNSKRRVDRRLRRGDHARLAMLLRETVVLLVEEVVAEAGRVQQQHPRGDVALGRAQLGLAVRVEALQHLQLADLRRVGLGRRVEIELAVLDQLQARRAGDRLGRREDREHACRASCRHRRPACACRRRPRRCCRSGRWRSRPRPERSHSLRRPFAGSDPRRISGSRSCVPIPLTCSKAAACGRDGRWHASRAFCFPVRTQLGQELPAMVNAARRATDIARIASQSRSPTA